MVHDHNKWSGQTKKNCNWTNDRFMWICLLRFLVHAYNHKNVTNPTYFVLALTPRQVPPPVFGCILHIPQSPQGPGTNTKWWKKTLNISNLSVALEPNQTWIIQANIREAGPCEKTKLNQYKEVKSRCPRTPTFLVNSYTENTHPPLAFDIEAFGAHQTIYSPNWER